MFPRVRSMAAVAPALFLLWGCGEAEPPPPQEAPAAPGMSAPPPPDAAVEAPSPSPAITASEEVSTAAPDAPSPAEPAAAAPAPVAAAASPPEAPQAFAACRSCHSVEAGAAHRIGPNLFGVVGAPAGRHADFAYSDGMAQAGFSWTEERLDAFLLAPREAVPGNRMMAAPVRDAQARRDIIDYLSRLKDE